MQRKLVAAVAVLAVLASAGSVLLGAPPGARFGYQIMTAHSSAVSWLVIVVMLAVTGVPLASFVLRDELYMWHKQKMRFLPYDRDRHPIAWWLLLWTYLALFLVILAGLFIFSR